MKLVMLSAATLALAISSAAHSNEDRRDRGSSPDSHRSGTSVANVTTQAFVEKAAMSGLAEVQLGQLASQKGGSAEVRQFGEQMVADHRKANAELAALAGEHDLSLPTALDAEHRAILERLQGLEGRSFDQSYANAMVASHAKAISLFESGADVDDREVAAFASDKLPTLRLHATHAERLRSSQ